MFSITGFNTLPPNDIEATMTHLANVVSTTIYLFIEYKIRINNATTMFSSSSKLLGGLAPTPSYKEPIPGSEQPFLETYFFLHFLPRLSGNDRSRVISMANFGPTASNLRYDF